MAWEYIEWSCDHETRQQLYGPHKERERFVEWAKEKGLCPDCYRTVRQAEEDRQRTETRKGMPDLPAIADGTEKQNAYAEDVRTRLWGELEKITRAVREHPRCPPEYEDLDARRYLEREDDAAARRSARIFALSSHRFWLDVGSPQSLASVIVDPSTAEYPGEGT